MASNLKPQCTQCTFSLILWFAIICYRLRVCSTILSVSISSLWLDLWYGLHYLLYSIYSIPLAYFPIPYCVPFSLSTRSVFAIWYDKVSLILILLCIKLWSCNAGWDLFPRAGLSTERTWVRACVRGDEMEWGSNRQDGSSRGVQRGFERMKAAYRRLPTFPGTRGRRRLSPVKLRNVAPQTKICGAIQTSLAVARDSVRASTLTGGLSCISGVRIKWMACLCGRKAEKPQRSPQPPLLLSDMLTAQRKQVESQMVGMRHVGESRSDSPRTRMKMHQEKETAEPNCPGRPPTLLHLFSYICT